LGGKYFWEREKIIMNPDFAYGSIKIASKGGNP
jgi:hypothetical protein